MAKVRARACSAMMFTGTFNFPSYAIFACLHTNPVIAFEFVSFVHRIDVLHQGGKPLEPHAGIDARPGKRVQLAFRILVELVEHQVPVFQEPLALASRFAVGLAAAVRLAPVDVELGAGTAGAGIAGRAPEIVRLTEPHNLLLRYADPVLPYVERLVVVLVYRYPDLFGGKPDHFGGIVPGRTGWLLF